MKRFVFVAPLLIFAAIGFAFFAGLQRNPAYIPSELIDQPLPKFDLAPIAGFDRGLSSSEIKGDVALINVFASWCPPCRIEHPFLMELSRNGSIPLYGINWKDKPGDGTAWLNRFGNPYNGIGDDADGRVAIDLGVTGAPETFIVDREGRVRYKYVGPITPDVWRRTLAPMIEELKNP